MLSGQENQHLLRNDCEGLHFLSIADFIDYCEERKIHVENSEFIRKNKKIKLFSNFLRNREKTWGAPFRHDK